MVSVRIWVHSPVHFYYHSTKPRFDVTWFPYHAGSGNAKDFTVMMTGTAPSIQIGAFPFPLSTVGTTVCKCYFCTDSQVDDIAI